VRDSAARLVTLGRIEVGKVTDTGYARAADYARKALHVDTTNASAWALLSESVGRTDPALVYSAARRAVALDSTSAVTWTALARAQFGRNEFQAADRSFARALALDPKYGWAFGYYANLLAGIGRFEQSLDYARKAASMTPYWADASYPALMGLGRYDELLAEGQAGVRKDSTDSSVQHYSAMGIAYVQKGQKREALHALDRWRVVSQNPRADAWAYARLGEQTSARSVLAELKKKPRATPGEQAQIAAIHANLGEADSAFNWLARARASGGGLTSLSYHPQWEPIKGDPRFSALKKEVGLEK
jgi:tetratricopeptide (TPR) repeat protein